jgi:glutathione S-transferase
MPTLYGNLEASNVYKVRQLSAQLGIAHRRVHAAQFPGEPRTAKFPAINPIGKVPTVRFDDGRVLSESGAILFYLANGTSFLPSESWDMGECAALDVFRAIQPRALRRGEWIHPAACTRGGASASDRAGSRQP